MITLRKGREFEDGTADYTFSYDDAFIKYYVDLTSQPVEDKLVGEFISKLIYEAVGESYTKVGRDFVKFKG